MLSAAAAAGLYGFATGKGPFNKARFKEQHDALSRYVDNNYPDCSYTSIAASGTGWMSSVRRRGSRRPLDAQRAADVLVFFKKPGRRVRIYRIKNGFVTHRASAE